MVGRLGLIAGLALTVAGLPHASDAQTEVTIETPVPTVLVDQPALAAVLRACLFDPERQVPERLSQEAFAERCVLPAINGGWLDEAAFYRPLHDLGAQAAQTVLRPAAGEPVPLYYPAVLDDLLAGELGRLLGDREDVVARPLPDPLPAATLSAASLYRNAGLLFLPNPYVAARAGASEMRGWQAVFIIEGLLASADYVMRHPDARIWLASSGTFLTLSDDPRREAYFARYAEDLFRAAKGMLDNLVFEIEFYGGHVLAANRPYAMRRAAPPMLTHAALLLLEMAERHGFDYVETLAPYLSAAREGFEAPATWDEWVRSEVLPAAIASYRYWTDPDTAPGGASGNPRVASLRIGQTTYPVYRYAADFVGPAPEVMQPAVPRPSNRYAEASDGLAADPVRNAGNRYRNPNRICFGAVRPTGNCGDPTYRLTEAYYASDLAQRVSGTRSGRFGLYGEFAGAYAALDLNVLVYAMARDIERLAERVGAEPATGEGASAERRAFLLDAFTPPTGGLADRFVLPLRPSYAPLFAEPHGLQFVALWADLIADRGQIRVLLQNLARVTADGPGFLVAPDAARYGVPASFSEGPEAWDGPLGWAPIQYFAAGGLLKVGALTTARTVMRHWLTAVNTFFALTGETLPAYDVNDPARDPRPGLDAEALAAGEAWTNATYVTFVNTLEALN